MKKIEKRGKLALARFISLFLNVPPRDPAQLDRDPPRRLLIIRQHNQMGDMLLAVPAFRGLRGRFPQSHISLLAASINTDVMLNNPYLDRVFKYAKERNRGNPLRILSFIRELRKCRFDAVIVLNTVSFSITSMLLAVACGAPLRIGSTSRPFGHDLSVRFYHLELPLPSDRELEGMHESEHNLYPLSRLGVVEKDLSSLIVPREGEREECDRFLRAAVPSGGRFAVIHPGAGKKRNVWGADKFASLARTLNDRHALTVIVVGGPADNEAVDDFLKHFPSAPVLVSSPAPGFLAALMKKAAVTICNDTGIMHIAGAAGARCVAVFGPTDPLRWKPVGDRVVAVRSRDGRLQSLGVEEVEAVVKSLL
ncbi:MAG: glycosyltransferase family 9 protein [Candidatus Krumholzibacteriota bacterium]|nr:glycosyltransferase family 9 protein [Candidatus Krumholzibacteriota bacterium]